MDCNTFLNLTEREYSFILDMARKSGSDAASELSDDTILRAMIRLLQRLSVDVSGVTTEDQLLERLQNAARVN